MATQKDIALNIKVKFEGANTVQELEDVLKEINKEMENVDENSHAFAILKNTASKATKEIQELNTKIKDLNGEAKTVKSGMEGLKGSTELVTQANGKLASSFENITSNGGAIAVLDSLTGGLATKIKDAFEASKLFNFSLKGMKTALISTGIGAFVVLLGLAVAYWDDIKDAILGTNRQLERKLTLLNESIEKIDEELSLLDQQETILKLQGKSTEDVRIERQKMLLIQQKTNDESLRELELDFAKQVAREKEFTILEKIKAMGAFFISNEMGIGVLIDATNGKTEKTKEIAEQVLAAKRKQGEITIALLNIENDRKKSAEGTAKAKKEELDATKKLKDITLKEEAELDSDVENDPYYNMLIQRGQAILDLKEHQAKLELEADKQKFDSEIEWNEYKANKLVEIEANAAQARKDLALNLYDSLLQLSQTFFDQTEEGQKKAFEFNKMVATAETIVSTYLSAQKAYESQMALATPDAPFRAAVAAGLAIASGLAKIATIQRTQFNSTSPSGADGGGGNIPSNSTLQRRQSTTPNVPIIETGGEGQKIKVYVTETDIRNTTKKMTSIYSKAIVTE